MITPNKLIQIHPEAFAGSIINSTSYQQDNLTSFNGYQYGCFVDKDAYMVVFKRNLTTDDIQLHNTGLIVSNLDSHQVPTIGIDANGYVHMVYNMHASQLKYTRSVNAEDITSWTVVGGMTGQNETQTTYPQFMYDNSVAPYELYFTYRSGGSGYGDQMINKWDRSTSQWEVVMHPVIKGTSSVPDECPYMNHPQFDDLGRCHMSWVWRETTNVITNHDMMYAVSAPSDLTRWYKSNGEEYTFPITSSNAEIILPIPQGVSYANVINQQGMCVTNNIPHIGFWKQDRYDQDPSTTTQIYHLYFNGTIGQTGGEWVLNQTTQRTTICALGEAGTAYQTLGRPDIAVKDDGSVYILSRDSDEQNGRFTIVQSKGTDYTSWTEEIIYDQDLYGYEPIYDRQRWKEDGILSSIVLHCKGGALDTNYPPEPLYLLEWDTLKPLMMLRSIFVKNVNGVVARMDVFTNKNNNVHKVQDVFGKY